MLGISLEFLTWRFGGKIVDEPICELHGQFVCLHISFSHFFAILKLILPV